MGIWFGWLGTRRLDWERGLIQSATRQQQHNLLRTTERAEPTERFQQRLADFQKAVSRLEEACTQPESSFLRDPVIQRFEFSWEIAWKLLKLQPAAVGIEALSPREVIRQSLQAGLIQDGNVWTDAKLHRNMTSHTYDEALSKTVYVFVKGQGLHPLRRLASAAAGWTK